MNFIICKRCGIKRRDYVSICPICEYETRKDKVFFIEPEEIKPKERVPSYFFKSGICRYCQKETHPTHTVCRDCESLNAKQTYYGTKKINQ